MWTKYLIPLYPFPLMGFMSSYHHKREECALYSPSHWAPKD